MSRNRSCALVLAPFVSLVAACPSPSAPPTSQSALIGSEGGSLAIASGTGAGATVTVPASAVSEDTTFTVSAADGATDLPAGVHAVGPTITFGPEGLSFTVAVAIEAPATEAPDRLLTRPHGIGAWTVVEGAVWVPSARVMMANVTHFSDFVPVVDDAATEDAGTPDAAMCGSGFDTEGHCNNGGDRDCDGLVDCDDSDCAARAHCMPQTCDVLAASDSCAAGQHCALDGTTEHPWVPVAGCVASGSGAEGEPCLAQTDCGAGLSCTRFFATADPHGRMYFTSTLDETPMENQQRCMRVCNEHGDWAETECGAGQWCHPIVQTDAMAGTTIDGTMIFSGYGACAEPLPEGTMTP